LCDLGQCETIDSLRAFSPVNTFAGFTAIPSRDHSPYVVASPNQKACGNHRPKQDAVVPNDAIHGISAERVIDFDDYDHGSNATANEPIPPSGKQRLADSLQSRLLLFFGWLFAVAGEM